MSCTKREELMEYEADILLEGNGCDAVYLAGEADSVMDALEARIKELEEDLEQANNLISVLEANQPKWISVKDKLPEEAKDVWVTDGTNCWEDMKFVDDDGDFFWDCGGCDVIAWMPLPEAPKSED